MAQLKPIRLGISQWFYNKQNNAPEKEGSNRYAFATFAVASLTTEQIATHITTGKAICVSACKKNWRNEENFISAQLIGVDYDHNTSVRDLALNKFIEQYGFLIYATPSSTPENPRSRVLFMLDAPIENLATYKVYVKRLLQSLSIGNIDEQCKDGVRIFYGSDTDDFSLVRDVVLPIAVLEALPQHPSELPKPELPPRREVDTSNPHEKARYLAYAKAVRENELAALESVPDGMDLRHGAINGATMRLVGFIKGGWAGFEGVEDELRSIGRRWGRSEQEIEASIKGAYVKATPTPVALPENNAPYKVPGPTANGNGSHGFQPPAEPVSLVTWRTSDESMARYRERLSKPVNGAFVPLVFPFRSLWDFGGFCRAISPGVLIGVIGLSGGMKTSFVETLTDAWRQMGAYDVLWWGPEWDWQRMADRAVQRYGTTEKPTATTTQTTLHEMWLAEEAANIPISKRFGEKLPEHIKKNSDEISQMIERWGGKNHYVEQMEIDLDSLLIAASERIDEAKGQGRNIRIAVFDYVQLLEMRSVRSESERINIVLGRIKAFCVEHKLIGIVASQVTKSSSSAARETGDTLKAESGQFFRSDKFNLVLTLNPRFEGQMLTQHGVINVAKNSTGQTGAQTVFIDPSRYKWLDKKVKGMTSQPSQLIGVEDEF